MSSSRNESPLLREAITDASCAPQNGAVSSQTLIDWLHHHSDNQPLANVLRGSQVDTSKQVLNEATQHLQLPTMLQMVPATEDCRRRAHILQCHLRGKQPAFDEVHRSRNYAYSGSDEPSALAREIAKTAPNIAPDIVIDFGAGNLRDARTYTSLFPKAHVLGVDNSAAALETARRHNAQLGPDRRDRLHIVDQNLFAFVEGGREQIADIIQARCDRLRIGLAACSSLHFSTRSDTEKLLQGIVQLIGQDGWLATLHRTTEDPFGKPGILLDQQGEPGNQEQVRIHGQDGIARRFWDRPVQEKLVAQAGGGVIDSQPISEGYDSDTPAHFGYIFAVQNDQ